MIRLPSFGIAFKTLRLSRGLSQQSFAAVTTREHISRLERGLSYPNLRMVCDLAEILQVHPLSLLTIAFCDNGGDDLEQIIEQIRNDVAYSRLQDQNNA